MSCERIVPTADLLASGPPQSLLINRAMVAGVVETPNGAHFTSCVPDYGRDEAFQALYARSAASQDGWAAFAAEFLAGDESATRRRWQVRRAARADASRARRRAVTRPGARQARGATGSGRRADAGRDLRRRLRGGLAR